MAVWRNKKALAEVLSTSLQYHFKNPRRISSLLQKNRSKMALCLGVFSSFLPRGTVSFGNSSSSSSSSVRIASANLRSVTMSAAAKPATETKKREPRGIMKPRRVSPEMQAFIGGASEIPRTQALKEIWAYIKKHNLQVTAKT